MSTMPSSRDRVAPVTVAPEQPDVETSSDDYARRFSGAVGAWFLQVQESATVRMLAEHRGATVLDVGGGHGQVTAALVARGHRVIVFGSAPACRRRIEPFVAAGRCAFEWGDLLGMPYPDRAHDVVIAYRLLSHVTRWQALLRELGRVARQAVLIDVPTARSVNALAPSLFDLKRRLEGNTRTFTVFEEREVLDVAASAGFTMGDRYAQFVLPMALHRALRAPRLSSALEDGARHAGLTRRFGSPVILKLVRRRP
jgi:2-polyprenyl-3-methyl-5-hydroxy-6-metoxy-1,4-benzoquinol methylase